MSETIIKKSDNLKLIGFQKKHGLRYHRLYFIWNQIMQRTTNKNNKAFEYYGGRGIAICERWMDVENFIEDMYPSYKEGLAIDRIDNDCNYEPSNCRWATRSIQSRNTRLIYRNNTSGYRGVTYVNSRSNWQAQITINDKRIFLGRFKTPEHAAMAYDTFVIVYGLEHTCNFPKGVFK